MINFFNITKNMLKTILQTLITPVISKGEEERNIFPFIIEGGHILLHKLIVQYVTPHPVYNKNGDSELISLVKRTNSISDFLSYGINDINHQNIDGNTALILTAIQEKLPSLQLLLDYDADPNIVNSRGDSALIIASDLNHFPMIQSLIEKKANVHIKNNNQDSAIIVAKNPKIITYLLQHGANINDRDINRQTPLMRIYDDIDCFQCLLDHNANINLCDNSGSTILMKIAKKSRRSNAAKQAIRLLVEMDVDLDILDNSGKNALFYCLDPYILECLTQKGADTRITFEYKGEKCSLLKIHLLEKNFKLAQILLDTRKIRNDEYNDLRTILKNFVSTENYISYPTCSYDVLEILRENYKMICQMYGLIVQLEI